ncbi:ribose 5-phosphate isomerase B [Desulforhopalus sp. IMCC35007]|uniref:ribose 5-phosphate isomerase B n=1 Tax=Desulforhopalus sp. IMCC35007 TaxID=2569543 RepID=UPI0010AE8A17|nr:ribose 5-phosphate isomerase B [Desulforhopalus sp. IMCC35007]TKB09087.1 ribose 5-phosphate isomerase B [Desulforhopalus sp. IMCC35007]
MIIAVGADHGGYELKTKIIHWLTENGHTVSDVGCHSNDSVDYPDYAEKVVQEIVSGTAKYGILICGTGIGMSIAANRHYEIRAANCFDENTAALSREHNNANVLCLGARVLSEETALNMVRIWLKTDFAGGRHTTRIEKFSK